jgi:hypothetical protein
MTINMKPVCLEDFDDPNPNKPKRGVFDADNQLSPVRINDRNEAQPNSQGYYSIRKLGLLRRCKARIAVYSTGQTLHLAIQNETFSISDPGVVAVRKRLFFGAREFQLLSGGNTLTSFSYWNTPGKSDGGGDIFEYLERVTRSTESKMECLRIWNAQAAAH